MARTAKDKAIPISAKLTAKINGLKSAVKSYVASFKVTSEKRAELAPRVMSAYGAWMTETGRASFIEFARLLDPSIPTERDKYLVHAGYNAITYLRRLRNRQDDQPGRARTQPLRANLDYLGRALATVVQALPEPRIAEFWAMVGKELALKAAQLKALKAAVEKADPLVVLPVVQLRKLEVVHAGAAAEAASEREEKAA